MASSDLELVRSIYEGGWAEGDFSDNRWADPEIEVVVETGLERATYRGIEEMSSGWGEFLRAWDGLRAVPDEFHELPDGRILVILHNQGRGRSSGVDISEMYQRSANLFELEGGKVMRLITYFDGDQAFEDLGLPPPKTQ